MPTGVYVRTKSLVGKMPRRVGPENHSWRGGRTVHPAGYVQRSTPGHPRASGGAGYVFEHILVAEKALGRFLPVSAQVHHVNRIRTDNRPENLVVCQGAAYHQLLHRRQRALDACGDASARRCVRCSSYENQADIHVTKTQAYHRACQAKHERERKARIRLAKTANG